MAAIAVAVQNVYVKACVAVTSVLGHQDSIGFAAQTAVNVSLIAGKTSRVAWQAVVIGKVIASIAFTRSVEQGRVGLACYASVWLICRAYRTGSLAVNLGAISI